MSTECTRRDRTHTDTRVPCHSECTLPWCGRHSKPAPHSKHAEHAICPASLCRCLMTDTVSWELLRGFQPRRRPWENNPCPINSDSGSDAGLRHVWYMVCTHCLVRHPATSLQKSAFIWSTVRRLHGWTLCTTWHGQAALEDSLIADHNKAGDIFYRLEVPVTFS